MANFTGIGGMIGSFIGADDLEDRFNQALDELHKFQEKAQQTREGFQIRGVTAFTRAGTELTAPSLAPDIASMRAMLVTNVSSGLSPFAQLQFEDLNRVLENRASATGNLRSGAIGLQRAELGRRIAADEFGRALQTLDVLRKGDLSSSQGYLQAALGFGKLENQALDIEGGTTANIAKAYIGLGSVEQQASVALGSAAGGLADKAEEYAKAYATGGMSFTGMLKNLR